MPEEITFRRKDEVNFKIYKFMISTIESRISFRKWIISHILKKTTIF